MNSLEQRKCEIPFKLAQVDWLHGWTLSNYLKDKLISNRRGIRGMKTNQSWNVWEKVQWRKSRTVKNDITHLTPNPFIQMSSSSMNFNKCWGSSQCVKWDSWVCSPLHLASQLGSLLGIGILKFFCQQTSNVKST